MILIFSKETARQAAQRTSERVALAQHDMAMRVWHKRLKLNFIAYLWRKHTGRPYPAPTQEWLHREIEDNIAIALYRFGTSMVCRSILGYTQHPDYHETVFLTETEASQIGLIT